MATFVNLNRRTATLAVACCHPWGCAPQGLPTAAVPTKLVRIITFPVGGGPDGVAPGGRQGSPKPGAQSVVVENRPGGNGFIAIDAFKRGAKDGQRPHRARQHYTWPPTPACSRSCPTTQPKVSTLPLPLFRHLLPFLHRGHPTVPTRPWPMWWPTPCAPWQTSTTVRVGGQPGAPGLRSCSRA